MHPYHIFSWLDSSHHAYVTQCKSDCLIHICHCLRRYEIATPVSIGVNTMRGNTCKKLILKYKIYACCYIFGKDLRCWNGVAKEFLKMYRKRCVFLINLNNIILYYYDIMAIIYRCLLDIWYTTWITRNGQQSYALQLE